MTEFEIDPSTGLPRLPENQRWNVTDRHMAYFREGHTSGHHYVDAIELQKFIPASKREVSNDRLVTKTHRTWYGRKIEHDEWETVTETKEFPDTWGNVSVLEIKDGLTKKSILKAANDVLRYLDALQERESLLGAYPPKSL